MRYEEMLQKLYRDKVSARLPRWNLEWKIKCLTNEQHLILLYKENLSSEIYYPTVQEQLDNTWEIVP